MKQHRDGATPGDWLRALPLYLLPHHALSRLVFRLTRIRQPAVKNALIRTFARHFRIDWSEAAAARPEDYPDFNAFFTRALREGARAPQGDARCLTSPADGRVSQLGAITSGRLIQAKGRDYGLDELLGGPAPASGFDRGHFLTVYLSPRDYHRVHMPADGRLLETRYIPGRLFSVAPHTTCAIPRLFARNERLACLFETAHGPMALVLVGAIFVAAIETRWAGLVTPPHRRRMECRDYRDAGIRLARGEEMGRFNMGSTVIALFGNPDVALEAGLQPGTPLKTGQIIARLPG